MKAYLSSYQFGNNPEKFSELVGKGNRVAVIENAKDALIDRERAERLEQQLQTLKELGLSASELDLRNYFGKPDELTRELADFSAVWVCGGNVFVLRRAMHDSGFDNAIRERLKKDNIVYGGYSAGSCVLARR